MPTGGGVLTIYPCGGGVYHHSLSIYLRLWTCMNYLWGVMDGGPRTF
jgi:hypothetical protein